MSNTRNSDFFDNWGYVTDVMSTIQDAEYYKITESDKQFKSGKQVFTCYFLNKDMNGIVTTRRAMKLLSKITGNEYFLVEYKPNKERKFTPETIKDIDVAFNKLVKH